MKQEAITVPVVILTLLLLIVPFGVEGITVEKRYSAISDVKKEGDKTLQSTKGQVSTESYIAYPVKTSKKEGKLFEIAVTTYGLATIKIKAILMVDGKEVGDPTYFTPASNEERGVVRIFVSKSENERTKNWPLKHIRIEYYAEDRTPVGNFVIKGE